MEGKYSFTSPEWADISGETNFLFIYSQYYYNTCIFFQFFKIRT